jgi:hypothetical protein
MFKFKPSYFDQQMKEYRENYRVAPEVENMYELCRGSMPPSVAFCFGALTCFGLFSLYLFVTRTLESGGFQWLITPH